jgi:hypothetical protein
MPQSFAVIYRTGGTANFHWRRLFNEFAGADAKARATAEKTSLERMGYAALVMDAGQLEAIGLPETYDARDAGSSV